MPVHEAMLRGRHSRVGHHEGMLKTIEVGDLRRDSTEMITDVLEGVQYLLMVDGREVAKVVPLGGDQRWVRNRDQVDAALACVTRDLDELAALAETGRRSGMDGPAV